MTRVSVVLPFLNAGPFLDEAIQSVRGQTYESWELLLVDDGSSDASTEIARATAAADPDRVRYFRHAKSRGMSASRNAGVDEARGELIAFLDGDDAWLPEKLAEQVAILETFPEAAMVYGPVELWRSWADGTDELSIPNVDLDRLVRPPELLARHLRSEGPTITPALLRRSIVAGLRFDETFTGMFEDQVLFAKIALREPIFVSSRCWYRWRQHTGSACATSLREGRYAADKLVFLGWLSAHVKSSGIDDRDVWASIQSQLAQPRSTAVRTVRSIARKGIDASRRRRRGTPASAAVRFGDLRRLEPISRVWGYDRGTPIDRRYIERFLELHREDIHGRVLEAGDASYTRTFGGSEITSSDVLNLDPTTPGTTVSADLSTPTGLEPESFDCVLLTQTLQFVYDTREAVRTLRRVLRPGGVVLATVPGNSQLADQSYKDSWYWSFTSNSVARLFGDEFGPSSVEVHAYGNVLSTIAFLHGIAAEELTARELDMTDPEYELIVAVRARKEPS
jgi:SAM-dependent methyltransferase